MQGRSRYALIFLLLSFARCGAEPCIESALLTPSTVSITRTFDEAERATEPPRDRSREKASGIDRMEEHDASDG